MKPFRNFIYTDDSLWLEMALGYKSRGVQMPIPQAIADLLRIVPSEGKKANYKNALEWIFSKGLYYATKRRHDLAKQASQMEVIGDNGQKMTLKQKLGRPIYDHEVYSPKAWQQIPELKKLYDETYAKNPHEYEPKNFILSATKGDNVLRINMAKANQILQKLGKQPFQFGGPNGLIEYMENGKWAPPRSAKGPLFHQGPQHNRHGFDLSKPQLSYHPESGSYMYHFADFDPPQNNASAQQAQLTGLVNGLLKNSHQLYQNYISGKETGIGLSPEVKQDLERIKAITPQQDVLSGDISTVADTHDFHNKMSTSPDFGPEGENDLNTYALLSTLMRMGIDEAIDQGRISPENKEYIEKQLLDPNTFVVGRQYYADKDVKHQSYRRSNALINFGVERLQRIGVDHAIQQYVDPALKAGQLGKNPNLDEIKKALEGAYSHEVTNKTQITGEPIDLSNVGERVPLAKHFKPIDDKTIEHLMEKGYRWLLTRGEKQQGLREPAPERNFATLELGDHELRLRRGPDGGWLVTNAEDEHPGEPLGKKFKKSVAPFMFGNTAKMKFNPNMPEKTPLDPEMNQHLQDDMIKNPQKYGYGLGEEDELGMRNSIDDLDSALRKASYNASSNSRQGRAFNHDAGYSNALMGMLQHGADYRFMYGNVSQDNDKLRSYLAMPKLGNASDPAHQEGWIKKMQLIQKAGKEPQSENKADTSTYMPQGVLNAFLVNGKWWRQQKATNFATGQAKKEEGKEKVRQTTSDDGETQSLAHNIAAGGEKGGTGRLASDLRTDYSFDSSNKGRKKPTRDPLTAEYDPDVLTSLDPEERQSDIKQAFQTQGLRQNLTGGIFYKNSVKELPERQGEENVYNKRYQHFRNQAQQLLVGNNISEALGKMLQSNESENPEETRALVDAIGDAVNSQIVKLSDQKMISPHDLDEIYNLYEKFVTLKGEYSIRKLAKQHNIENTVPAKEIVEFLKTKPDLFKKILQKAQQAQQNPAPVAPPAPPQAAATSRGVDMGSQTSGGFVMGEPEIPELVTMKGERFRSPSAFRKALSGARGTPREKELLDAARNSGIPLYTNIANTNEHFIGYSQWRQLKETDAIYDGTKPKTFNWWGSVGLPGGKVIDGEPIKNWTKKNKRRKK